MAVRKLSLSLTPELADALDRLAAARGEDRSRLVETLLREHDLVRNAVRRGRPYRPVSPGDDGGGGDPPLAKARFEAVGRRKRLRLD